MIPFKMASNTERFGQYQAIVVVRLSIAFTPLQSPPSRGTVGSRLPMAAD
jgi:hypothetical protein